VPAPDVDEAAPLQMQVAALQYSEYVGKIVVGRVSAGKIARTRR
jgi:GTP-binding protein